MRDHARATKDAPAHEATRNAAKSAKPAASGMRSLKVVVTAGRRTDVGTPTGEAGLDGAAPSPELVRAAAHAASANVTLVADSLRSAAIALRSGDWRNGRCLLAQNTATVRTLMLVTDMLASIPGLSLSRKSGIDVVIACLKGTLAALESKRVRGDWEGVMSILDNDAADLLSEWSSELRVIGDGGSARLVQMPPLTSRNRVTMDLPEAG
ncbi:MAG: hypothetical protein HOP16_00185 [Acidobacteria bacterium]|nr:hypothetical protein [Acidobacteriota bacterium]